MGLILETDDDVLGLERRKESYIICDLKRVFQPNQADPRKVNKSKHIFANADGEIEMSADILLRILQYFAKHPDECEELEKRAVKP